MEQIFPEIKIVEPRKALKAVVQRVQGFLALGTTTELCLSEHNRGASAMLDAALDECQLTLQFDDMGNYTSFVEGE